jgi:hypothetical protein
MKHTYLVCLSTHDRGAAPRLSDVLRGHKVLFVDRAAPPLDAAKEALKDAALEADVVLLVAEPEDAETDPLVFYTIGVANALGKAIWAISHAPRSKWPADVLAQLDAVKPWPSAPEHRSEAQSVPRVGTRQLENA